MRFAIPAILALCNLAACTSDPTLINPTPAGVSYQYHGNRLVEVTRLAQDYCNKLGKIARLSNVAPTSDDNVAIYDCS
jgi:hypothetical protein